MRETVVDKKKAATAAAKKQRDTKWDEWCSQTTNKNMGNTCSEVRKVKLNRPEEQQLKKRCFWAGNGNGNKNHSDSWTRRTQCDVAPLLPTRHTSSGEKCQDTQVKLRWVIQSRLLWYAMGIADHEHTRHSESSTGHEDRKQEKKQIEIYHLFCWPWDK